MTKRLTKEEFIKKAREVHGDKYDYSKVEYVNLFTKVEIICPIHGSFFQSPSNHLYNGGGNGCPKCAKISRIEKERGNTEEFIRKAKNIHGDKYDYSKINYINCKTKIEIVCPIHGSFWQTPNDHLSGCGCPECGKEKAFKSKRDSTDIFIEKAKNIHGDKYDYSRVKYVNSHTPVEIICPIHGSFFLCPSYHLYKSQGCPKCNNNNYKGESIVESWIKSNNFKYLHNNPIESLTRTSGSVKIDFCISISNSEFYNDVWIEYNGIQHYEYNDYFHRGDINNFKIQLERDKKVRDYCIINNIKLIEVPYIFDKEKLIFEFLDKTLIQNIDQNTLVDYNSLYKLPD